MRYFALATDYDGTLATHGAVDEPSLRALERFIASGRKLVMVTGRQVEDLERVFSRLDLFERVVAENGAVIYTPSTKAIRVLVEPPPQGFVSALRARGVEPLAVGHAIVATFEPHQATVLEVIRQLGLELHVEFNKGAVMVLPAGVTKRTGLKAALRELGLSPHNVVAVGDAENDHAFLTYCECGVAVANAIDSLKSRADWVTPATHGAGVAELVDRIVGDDLRSLAPSLARHRIVVGRSRRDDAEVSLPSYGVNVLVAGPSGSGKTTVASALTERLVEAEYQLCVVDPEGDHEKLASAAVVGTADHAPSVDEVAHLLDQPNRSVVAALLGVPMEERARWFGALLARIQQQRARVGRPHWLVVDEAHHVLPASHDASALPIQKRVGEVMLLTVEPATVARPLLEQVDLVIATGDRAGVTIASIAEATGRPMPAMPELSAEPGATMVVYWVNEARALAVQVPHASAHRQRHKRKYARGELGEDRSFWFRGPRGALRLRAQNLALFVQIADGVDDETWLHHLRASDYSRWFREAIKDDDLASEAAAVEAKPELGPRESRALIRAAIERRYTLPA
ncbi:MAG: HAD-IIB family hydrolase [Myxococcales bacterium]|nr:HAD-IIB family hydrolase [Myxococcales bacterium]